VVVEVMVMGEAVMVVAVPIPMPVVSMPSMATIPGNVTTTAPLATAPVSTSDMASMPTAAAANMVTPHATKVGDAGTTHSSTEVASAHSSEVASAHSSEVASAHSSTPTTAVSGVCVPHYDWSKQHAARKGDYCNDTLSHEYISLSTPKREPVRRFGYPLTQKSWRGCFCDKQKLSRLAVRHWFPLCASPWEQSLANFTAPQAGVICCNTCRPAEGSRWAN
jgi:hypothetical protein